MLTTGWKKSNEAGGKRYCHDDYKDYCITVVGKTVCIKKNNNAEHPFQSFWGVSAEVLTDTQRAASALARWTQQNFDTIIASDFSRNIDVYCGWPYAHIGPIPGALGVHWDNESASIKRYIKTRGWMIDIARVQNPSLNHAWIRPGTIVSVPDASLATLFKHLDTLRVRCDITDGGVYVCCISGGRAIIARRMAMHDKTLWVWPEVLSGVIAVCGNNGSFVHVVDQFNQDIVCYVVNGQRVAYGMTFAENIRPHKFARF